MPDEAPMPADDRFPMPTVPAPPPEPELRLSRRTAINAAVGRLERAMNAFEDQFHREMAVIRATLFDDE